MSEYPDSIFPIAFGNELERGIVDNTKGYFDEPYGLAENLGQYVPTHLRATDDFLTNGARLYVGGAQEGEEFYNTNIETATAECASPLELVRHMRAADFLIQTVSENYAKSISSHGLDVTVRRHHRVVDAQGNRKGLHDNFGLSREQLNILRAADKELLPELRWHLATRSFVTGALHVRGHKLHFAQKIGGLVSVGGYGYMGTMYRMDSTNGTPRVEVRCGDPNISDWASWVRIGSSALVLALMQTPLAQELKAPMLEDFSLIDRAKEMNSLRLDDDGELAVKKGDPLYRAIDFQDRLADLSLDKLQLYVDELPIEYFQIANELKKYCDDVRKVMSGEAPTSLLADRADWAAKLQIIQGDIERTRQAGERRFLGDIRSQAMDLRYDHISVHASHGELQRPTVGFGFKKRAKGGFRKTVSEAEVQQAYRKPPSGTRAKLRADILQHYLVTECDWQELTVLNHGEDELKIRLHDVRQVTLPDDTREVLEQVKQIR